MTEKIKELWKQAGGHYDSGNQHIYPSYNIDDPAKFAELVIAELVKKVEVSGEDFYYNEPNNYGAVTVRFYVDGDPCKTMMGNETKGKYYDSKTNGYVVRGTGRYTLNENFAKHLVNLCFSRG